MPASKPRSRTRRAILDAAESAFREAGFAATSIDDIARRAGLARGTIYYHFAAKDEIAVAIAERYRARGYARLLEQEAAGTGVLELLDDFFAFAGTWIAANREAAFIGTTAALRGIGRDPDRPGTTAVFEWLVTRAQADGAIRRDREPTAMARLLAGLLTQAALHGPAASASDVAAWPRELLAMTLDGLRPPPGDRP